MFWSYSPPSVVAPTSILYFLPQHGEQRCTWMDTSSQGATGNWKLLVQGVYNVCKNTSLDTPHSPGHTSKNTQEPQIVLGLLNKCLKIFEKFLLQACIMNWTHSLYPSTSYSLSPHVSFLSFVLLSPLDNVIPSFCFTYACLILFD